MELPAEHEINVHNSLDEMTASEHFLGKTLEQAEQLFRENSAYYQEDLMWMGPRAFSFYIQAAINYLKSEFSMGDDHMISCVCEILQFRLKQEGFDLAQDKVNDLIDYIINNYNKFEVDSHIYGDLLSKCEILRSQLISKGKNDKSAR